MRRTYISPLLHFLVLALLFTGLSLIFTQPVRASTSPWSWQNPLPQGSDLAAVWGSSPNDVFAVGANGTILHYNGASWQPMNAPTVAHLRGVWGSGPADVFVVGDGGVILHYDGAVWLLMSSGVSSGLWDVWGSGPADVFAVGDDGFILHYTGMGWLHMLSFVTQPIYGIWGSTADDIYAVGLGGAVHYDGLAWTSINIGATYALVDVWGYNSDSVYVVDGDWDTKVFYFNGSAWTTLQVPSYPAGGLWVAGTSEFFIVGYEGATIHCDGACSNSMPRETNQWLDAVWGSSSQDVFAVGSGGVILHFDGTNWRRMNTGPMVTINDIWGKGANPEYAVGNEGAILHYSGTAWEPMASGTTAGLSGVWGSASNDVFAVGNEGAILHYNGAAWEPMASGTTAGLSGVWGSAGNDVFAVGNDGVILHYNGTEWIGMNSGVSFYLTSIWGSSGSDVYAAGGSAILHYDGIQWSIDLQAGGMVDIWGANSGSVFAVSYDGIAWLRAGGHWTGYALANYPRMYMPTGIWGNSSDIYIAGRAGAAFGPPSDSGPILHYDGSGWSSVVGVPGSPTKLWGNDAGDLFAAGSGGMILHYITSSEQKAVEVKFEGDGGGRVFSVPSGVECTGWCVNTLAAGSTVTLQAVADSTSSFAGWSGHCEGSGACSLTLDGEKRVRANFARHTFSLNIVKAGTGSGSVTGISTGAGGSIDCGTGCSPTYAAGTAVYLTAAPAVDSRFDGWGGACSGTGTCAVLIDTVKTVTAIFRFVGEMNLVAHQPLAHEVGTEPGAPIHMAFEYAVDAATITTKTLAVYGSFSGLRVGNATAAGNTADYLPVRPFYPGEQVAVVTTRGIRSVGDKGVRPTQWTFTAGPVTNRCVSGFAPGSAASFIAAPYGSLAWGDYDGDGDLDVLVAARGGDVSPGSTHVYRNDGYSSESSDPSLFTEVNIDLTAAIAGTATWVDYDGDGNLDIAAFDVGGWVGTPTLGLYHSSGGPFPTFSHKTAFAVYELHPKSFTWEDYDNDGDLDLVANSQILRNDGSSDGQPHFVDIAAGLPSRSDSFAAWGDYDNDGDPDLLYGGYDSTKIYRNEGGATPTFTPVDAGIINVDAGAATWGDYDRDGDLDLLRQGVIGGMDRQQIATVFRNSGAPEYTFGDTAAEFVDIYNGTATWADYDNDGYLDVLLAGGASDPFSPALLYLYRNQHDGTFADKRLLGTVPVQPTTVAAGDADGDGDLDLLIAGITPAQVGFTQLFHNDDCPSLAVFKSGAGSGTITSRPEGINCGPVCRTSFAPGSLVNLTANTASNSIFVGWSGACTGSAACQVILDASKAVTATFDRQTAVLSVSKAGLGSGVLTSNPPGIDCGPTCSALFPVGTAVTLSAAPDLDSTFTSWSGGCSGSEICTVNLTAPATVVANFAVAGAVLPHGATVYYGEQLAARSVPTAVEAAAQARQTNLAVFAGTAPNTIFLVGVEGSEPYVDQTSLQRLVNRLLSTGCKGGACDAINCAYYESDGSRQDVVLTSWTPTDFVYMPFTQH